MSASIYVPCPHLGEPDWDDNLQVVCRASPFEYTRRDYEEHKYVTDKAVEYVPRSELELVLTELAKAQDALNRMLSHSRLKKCSVPVSRREVWVVESDGRPCGNGCNAAAYCSKDQADIDHYMAERAGYGNPVTTRYVPEGE